MPLPEPVFGHDPVCLKSILQLLAPQAGDVVVDCTLGRGGHANALAERIGPSGLLIALDADPRNLEFARHRLASSSCPVRFFHANFAELKDVMIEAGIAFADIILADLGISTNQLFEPSYGLSFASDMPLDMRLDPRSKRSAADLVNHLSENDLANVLYKLAQERYSRRIARKIGDARRLSPITTTERLADLVRSAIPRRGGAPERIDPATRTFLALRMAVNEESQNLEALLETAPTFLRPLVQSTTQHRAGRLAVISFQSMEDRKVKQAFRLAQQNGQVKLLTNKPITPTGEEVAANPRSRSAKLRAVERI